MAFFFEGLGRAGYISLSSLRNIFHTFSIFSVCDGSERTNVLIVSAEWILVLGWKDGARRQDHPPLG